MTDTAPAFVADARLEALLTLKRQNLYAFLGLDDATVSAVRRYERAKAGATGANVRGA